MKRVPKAIYLTADEIEARIRRRPIRCGRRALRFRDALHGRRKDHSVRFRYGIPCRAKSFFNRCRKLNQEVRVVVAHGSWSTAVPGTRLGNRSAKMHFEKPENLVKAAGEAVKLMDEFMQFGALANS